MCRFAPKVHLPILVTCWYPKALWRMNSQEAVVYLTFDDGPVPEVTPWVLEFLDREGIKATFFCVGENVVKYPEIFSEILACGHSVGNHTFNHMQGIRTSDQDYYRNIRAAAEVIHSNLFRPPHGLLKYRQYKFLSQHYQIVMWDIVTQDYNRSLKPERIIRNIDNYVQPGSLIAFHDSLKAKQNLKLTLPVVIKMLKSEGFQFSSIPFEKKSPLILLPEEKLEYLHKNT